MTNHDTEKAKAFVLSRYPMAQIVSYPSFFYYDPLIGTQKGSALHIIVLPETRSVAAYKGSCAAAWIAAAEYIVENG